MPLKLKEAVTVFLSVRKGLETSLLNEIKRNPHLNRIERIHFKGQGKPLDALQAGNTCETGLLAAPDGVGGGRIQCTGEGKWLRLPDPSEKPTNKKQVSSTPEPRKTKLVETCTIRVQSGGLEAKCNREWLIGCVLGLRTVESVWLRVGTPFRCHNTDELIQRVSLLPWNHYVPRASLEEIPLRVISRHSNVWSSVIIKECVRQGIRAYFSRHSYFICQAGCEPNEFCISVTLNRNTCYVAVQCSSRLSPRLFNFAENASCIDSTRFTQLEVPFWSLSKARLQVQLAARKNAASAVRETVPLGPPSQHPPTNFQKSSACRENYIQEQQVLDGDKYSTADALVAGLLHAGGIFRKLKTRPLKVWNPFCGNGLVVSEIVALLLQLPNFTLRHPPPPLFRDLATGCDIDLYDAVFDKYVGSKTQTVEDVEIVASDTSILKLNQAAEKLNRLHSFYNPLFEERSERSNLKEHATLFRQYRNRLPACLKSKLQADNNRVYEAIKEYKAFGHIIGSRSDWKGVFAIAKGSAFEHFSGLKWQCIAKATSSTGDVIKLLSWTGKLQKFVSPEERAEQLQELDYL
ncbi:uncharacterized protein BcabD6B2_29230 [Babesia caballi]|uniref:Uncharacterized protein n=1 Tax=Babesia caballi TaxID=5871 RepID=A0AAV4LU63_BABCB|nr:hypothetical protein, conserved [Babesia caballi]